MLLTPLNHTVKRRAFVPPTLNFRGKSVTVCIAAICPAAKATLLVSDQLMSSDWTSVEGVTKIDLLDEAGEWNVMFSATDARRYGPLLRSIRAKVSTATDAETIMSACRDAYKDEILKIIECEILLNLGWTRETFMNRGLRRLGETTYRELLEQIKKVELGVTLLVARRSPEDPFDKGVKLFEVNQTGETFEMHDLYFHAIGSGASMALGTLYPIHDIFRFAKLEVATYYLLAAKFAAESALGVGRSTTMSIRYADGDIGWVDSAAIDAVRQMWQREALSPPADAIARLGTKEAVMTMKRLREVFAGVAMTDKSQA